MTKRKKLLIAIPAVVVIVLLAALLYVGNYMVNFAIVRTEQPTDVSPDSVVTDENASVIADNRAALAAEAEIILHGTSMGGATVMMVSGEDLPDQSRALWKTAAIHPYGIFLLMSWTICSGSLHFLSWMQQNLLQVSVPDIRLKRLLL